MFQQPLERQRVSIAPQGSFSPTQLRSPTSPDSLRAAAGSTAAHKPSVTPRGFNPRSCNTCRRRKVKCDKVEGGCGNCVKAHAECVYPGPGRAPRRPKLGAVKGATERETELLKRLRRLEGVVEELSGQVEIEATKTTSGPQKQVKGADSEVDASNKSNGTPVRVVGMDEGSSASKEQWASRMMSIGGGPAKTDLIGSEFGKLVIDEGKSRYISNSFWARFVLKLSSPLWIVTDNL
jgi:hypothetical protein